MDHKALKQPIPRGNLNSRDKAAHYDNPRGYPGLQGIKLNKTNDPKQQTRTNVETSLARSGPQATYGKK